MKKKYISMKIYIKKVSQYRLYCIALFLLTLVSCSSPLDKAYNEQTFAQDYQAIEQSGKVSQEELSYIFMYRQYILLSRSQPEPGLTYQDIIDKGKDLKAKGKTR